MFTEAAPPAHRSRRRAIAVLLVPLALLTLSAAGCDAVTRPNATATVRGSSAPVTSAGQTTAVPDIQVVQVTNAGIGAYLETVLPVAVLTNQSRVMSALRLKVTFTVVTPRGATFAEVSTNLAILGAGQSTVVGARVAGNDVGGTARATVEVGEWSNAVSAVITASPGGFTCGRCGATAGYGDVSTTLTSNEANPPSPINVAVACTGADGTIVGGGSSKFAWTSGNLTQQASIPVLMRGTPSACIVGATPAS